MCIPVPTQLKHLNVKETSLHDERVHVWEQPSCGASPTVRDIGLPSHVKR